MRRSSDYSSAPPLVEQTQFPYYQITSPTQLLEARRRHRLQEANIQTVVAKQSQHLAALSHPAAPAQKQPRIRLPDASRAQRAFSVDPAALAEVADAFEFRSACYFSTFPSEHATPAARVSVFIWEGAKSSCLFDLSAVDSRVFICRNSPPGLSRDVAREASLLLTPAKESWQSSAPAGGPAGAAGSRILRVGTCWHSVFVSLLLMPSLLRVVCAYVHAAHPARRALRLAQRAPAPAPAATQ